MSTIQTVKTQIQSLIDLANTTTGNQDTNLTDGVNALVSGFGQGGSGGSASLNIHYGDTEPSDTSMLWCKCDEPSKVVISNDIGQLPLTFETLTTFTMTCSCITKVNDCLYCFYTNYVMKYNLKTQESTTQSITHVFSGGDSVVVAYGTDIYCFGGSQEYVYVFDTITETFTKLEAKFDESTRITTAELYGDKIYLFGGTKSGSYSREYIRVFDISSGEMITLSEVLPNNLAYMGSVIYGTKIYLFGGYYYNGSSSYKQGYVKTIYVFDIETKTTETLTVTLPSAMAYMGSVLFGTKVYLFGGYNGSEIFSTINVFDIETETIETLTTQCSTQDYMTYYWSAIIDGHNVYLTNTSYNIEKFAIQVDVPNGTLHILPTLSENKFNMLNGNQTLNIGVAQILLGNSDGVVENVDSYLYKDSAWTQI